MDRFSKKILKELEQMQHGGRILRSMSIARMIPADDEGWQPAVDLYEAEDMFLLYAEMAGVESETLQVVVDSQTVHLHGKRLLPEHPVIACIHQLEIELGPFQRSISLPAAVDIEKVESSYTNGVLLVSLPKRGKNPRRTIQIQSGE